MKTVWIDSYKRLAKILFIYDALLFTIIVLFGQIFGELYYTNILLIISYFVIITSFVSAIFSFVHSIITKKYQVIKQSIKMLVSGILLYIMIVILALASI